MVKAKPTRKKIPSKAKRAEKKASGVGSVIVMRHSVRVDHVLGAEWVMRASNGEHYVPFDLNLVSCSSKPSTHMRMLAFSPFSRRSCLCRGV